MFQLETANQKNVEERNSYHDRVLHKLTLMKIKNKLENKKKRQY